MTKTTDQAILDILDRHERGATSHDVARGLWGASGQPLRKTGRRATVLLQDMERRGLVTSRRAGNNQVTVWSRNPQG